MAFLNIEKAWYDRYTVYLNKTCKISWPANVLLRDACLHMCSNTRSDIHLIIFFVSIQCDQSRDARPATEE